MKKTRKPKWPWRLWYWTGPTESLFDLDREGLYMWELLVDEVFKWQTK